MRKKLPKILVTGGAGFIGSAFVRHAINLGFYPIVLDNLSYSGDLRRIKRESLWCRFYKVDISDAKKLSNIFKKEKPQLLVNFAAHTHVDRSIIDPEPFVKTNIEGVRVLMDICLEYKVKKFIQISTDEVYGETKQGFFREDSPLKPNSPYAATKAAADLLINSYIRTYKLPAVIIRPCNNFGPWQFPEKFIPVVIYNAIKNKKIPVYAKGLNIREWMYVNECVKGIMFILKKGKIGEIYNLGSGIREKNIVLAKKILEILKKTQKLISFVKDRPGHDSRYALNSEKINKLGWKNSQNLKEGLSFTILWYIRNLEWAENKIQREKNQGVIQW